MKIAILTSTRPLRERSIDVGREIEMLSPKKCSELAAQYDLIILGSRASDDFYERIRASLPKKVLDKFHLYSRGFFERFKRRGVRFIELTCLPRSSDPGQIGNPWDQHGVLKAGHSEMAFQVDQPIAGLIHDLKARGLFDEI